MNSVLNSNIFCGIWKIFLFSITAFSTYSLVKCKNRIEHERKELELHHRKHNCVVIYTGLTITGWPGFDGEHKITVKGIETAFEPICYFISTANKSLDIAVMVLHSNIIMDVIISTLRKGVRVRLLIDYDFKYRVNLSTALRYGAQIRYMKNMSDTHESIFHHKYAVKDYSDSEGYIIYGSSNWTVTSFTQNFEDLVFMSNHFVASTLHNNFEEMWSVVKSN